MSREPIAIVTADWHLCDDKPRCRGEADWISKQVSVVEEIVTLSNDLDIPIIILGDIMDKADKGSPELIGRISASLKKLRKEAISIMGNHDMILHNRDLSEFSAYMSLVNMCGVIYDRNTAMYQPFNPENTIKSFDGDYVFFHRYVYDENEKVPFSIPIENSAGYMCDSYPNSKILFFGDNHTRFIYRKGSQLVCNCGSIMRRTVKQKEYRPSVFILFNDHTVETYYLTSADSDIILSGEIKADTTEVDSLKQELLKRFVQVVKDGTGDFVTFRSNLEVSLVGGISEDYVMNMYKKIVGECYRE